MENIELFKKWYTYFDNKNSKIKDEFDLLCKIEVKYGLEIDAEWIKLSDEGKQIKRILTLRNVKKTLKADDVDMFRYEESIIDLYESIALCLQKIENVIEVQIDDNILRLKAMLNVQKWNINKYRDPRRIESLNYKIFKDLVFDCINSVHQDFFIQKSGIFFFESKLEIAQRLLQMK
jgi:hypothetical protein